MSDRTLTCRDCGEAFVFTAGEQDFYQQRGYSEPQRCRSCRDKRKTQRNSGSGYESNERGGGGFNNRATDSYSERPRQLYSAVCSECGIETQVPFSPTPGKPVYCRNCYANRRSSERYNTW